MRRIARLAARITKSNLRELPFPYRLTYAVTSRCQARCSMCNIWQQPASDELSLSEIDALFRSADRFSWINLTGGELFQRPDITDVFLTVIRRSRELCLLNFPTNGFQSGEITAAVDTILGQTDLPRLIVSVSMDGPPELHDDIRGLPGCWDHAVQTFGQLRQRQSGRFSVYFGHTLQTANIGKFDETIESCRRRLPNIDVDDFHINLAHVSDHYYGNAGTEAVPAPEEAVREIERISRRRKQRLLDPVSFIERSYQGKIGDYMKKGGPPLACQAAAASLFINPEGTVFPCTGLNAPIGSLRDSGMDFRRIWQSQSRSEARERVRAEDCPGCWTPCEAYQTILANLLTPAAYR